MKIAMFSHTCYPFTNGVSTSVEQLASSLRNRNHEVTLVSNNYDEFCNDFSSSENIKVVSIPIFYQKLRTPILFNPRLMKILADHNFDIAHSHSDFGLAMLARQYSIINNKPLIQTYHCDYLNYAKSNFGEKSKTFFKQPVKYYTKMICGTADRVIVPSLETKRLLNEDFHIKRDLDYIPNGVDISKFEIETPRVTYLKKQLGIKDGDFVLLSVSRLSKEKGLDAIISLLPLLKDCNKLKLLLVGGGPDEKKLKTLTNLLNLDNVIFTGEIPFEDIQNYYHLGSAFISNSHAETQGLTVIEALASSLPAFCPNIPIFQELVENNINGFLFNNYEELVNIIRGCYYNQQSLKNYKQNAKEKANQFSLSQSVQKIENVYEEECYKKTLTRK